MVAPCPTGEAHTMLEALREEMLHGLAPTVTVAELPKLLPAKTRVVLPPVVPLAGVTDVSVGASNRKTVLPVEL